MSMLRAALHAFLLPALAAGVLGLVACSSEPAAPASSPAEAPAATGVSFKIDGMT